VSGTAASGTASAGSTTWALLKDRNFGPYFWGNIASSLGVWGYSVAAVVVVFELTRSALFVGLVTIVQFSVPVVLAPVGGFLADRFDRRKLLVGAQGLSGVAVAVLAGAYALAVPDGLPSPWPLIAVSFVLGLALTVTDPARHALVPALVAPHNVGQAVALNSLTFNVGRAVGPAVAGVLLASAGPAAVFGVTSVAYATSVLSLWVTRPRRLEAPSGTDKGMGAGVRYVLRHRAMLAVLLGIGVAGFATDPVVTLTPLLAPELVRDSAGMLDVDSEELVVGLLASAFGAGAVLTMLVLRRAHRRFGYRPVGIAGLALLPTMLGILALSPPLLGLSCAVLSVAGVGYFLAMTSLTTLLQMSIPEHLRGRIMALWGVCFLGSRPLAAFIDSTLAHMVSARFALGVVALGGAVATVLVLRATSALVAADSVTRA